MTEIQDRQLRNRGRSKRTSARRRLFLACALASVLVGGCTSFDQWWHNGLKVGPNYATPSVAIADQWIDYQRPDGQAANQSGELKLWWQVFNDPVLNSLISDAYKQNLSLKEAGARIAEARAVRGIALGSLWPQNQTFSGSYTANKISENLANPALNNWFHDAHAGFNMSWELDFWGRLRRGVEAADASLDASIANYDDVLVVLLADVATNYIQYRTLQERLELAKVNVQIQEEGYQLASDSFKAGRSTEREPQQAKQVLEQTRSTIPRLRADLRRTNNALCVLLGISPQELARRLGETGTIPDADAQLDIGIPADLLRRRPDVRRAEREAAAQSASIGVAAADLYPRFMLIGSIGVEAEDFGSLFNMPGSLSMFGGPAFQWNIFNYGRIENNVKVQEARFQQLLFHYKDTVLRANREAEDAISDHVNARERVKYLAESVSAANRTLEITYDQYRHGAVDFTPIFIFEGTLTEQQDALAQARGDVALALISLYRSLGGGWDGVQEGEGYNAPPVPAPTTQRSATSRPSTLPAPAPPPAIVP